MIGAKGRRLSTVSDEGRIAANRVAELAENLQPYYEQYEQAKDSRAVFGYAYYNLSLMLADQLTMTGEFHEPQWVADLAVSFGNRYMSAMDAIDKWKQDPQTHVTLRGLVDESVPRPWADVYLAICQSPSTVLEDLVFAMGAHITYDLPHALVDVGRAKDHLADYHLMNDVLASRTDTIQDAVTNRYNPLIGRIERLVGNADELFTNYWLRIGRSMAWYNAQRLQSPKSREAAEESIALATHHLINSARSGPRLMQSGVALHRRLLLLTRRWPSASA